jgi:hypothetical protein
MNRITKILISALVLVV